MKNTKFDGWIKKILETEAEEISCSDCFELLPEYVEGELSHSHTASVHQKVKQHLNQCQVCREEFELLHDLARMDQDDSQADTNP